MDECRSNVTNDCDQLCINQEGGYRCDCFLGFQLIDGKCVEENVCLEKLDTCDQKCIPLPYGYDCDCNEGYRMVNGSCRAQGEDPTLYVASEAGVLGFNLRTMKQVLFVKTQSFETIVAIDASIPGILIYSGFLPGHYSTVYISKGDISHVVYQQRYATITGVSLDPLNRNLYMADNSAQKIFVCQLHTKLCTTIVQDLKDVRRILVVPKSGLLFWTQHDPNEKGIYMARMDGSTPLRLAKNKMRFPTDLAFDSMKKRIYWSDSRKGAVEYFDLETRTHMPCFQDRASKPFSVFLFEGQIIFSDWNERSIRTCPKFNCTQPNTLLKYAGSHDGYYQVAVSHPLLTTRTTENPCENHTCSHICLIHSPAKYTCHCPDHMTLAEDLTTCF